MPTFVSTIQFTEQGLANVRSTAERAQAFRAEAETMGVQVTELFWTLGSFDGMIIFEAPNEETATAVMLQLGSHGTVKPQTSRAYRQDEMSEILSKLSG